jgi:hypothetical protein
VFQAFGGGMGIIGGVAGSLGGGFVRRSFEGTNGGSSAGGGSGFSDGDDIHGIEELADLGKKRNDASLR